MKSFKKILFIVAIALFLPKAITFAAVGVVWDGELVVTPYIDGYQVQGSLNITGIEAATPDLALLLMTDDNGSDFSPPSSFGTLDIPATNGIKNFTIASENISNLCVLAVLVDESSWNNQPFAPYDINSNQFQVFVVGQSACPNAPTPPSPEGGSGGQGGGGTGGTGGGGQTVTTGADGWPQGALENPLEVDSINSFITGLLEALLKIGLPVMVVFLVYSGLRLVMARGNEKELADAKKNLLWVIIGSAVLLSAWTIVRILKGTLDEIDIVFISNLINHFV